MLCENDKQKLDKMEFNGCWCWLICEECDYCMKLKLEKENQEC